jgi:hypothetical protein
VPTKIHSTGCGMKAINKQQLKHKVKEVIAIGIIWMLAILVVYVVYLKIKVLLYN